MTTRQTLFQTIQFNDKHHLKKNAMKKLLSIFLLVFATAKKPAEVRYEWKYANYSWPSAKEHDKAIANGDYVPKHNPVCGIQTWKGKFYLTVPRMRPGVPVTLATISYQPVDGNKSPNLDPYPNWDMQKAEDCNAFQHVQTIKIDTAGRMWVINTGRINILDNPKALCPHRLVIFDLENNDKVLLNYEFPEDVVNPKTGYLNDIVLDHRDGGFAYITNADNVEPSIVVFSLRNLTSWKKTDDSMKVTDPIFSIKGDDTKVVTPIAVDGIAMAPADHKNPLVYFAPMSSKNLFAVTAADLKNRNKKIRVKKVSIDQNWHSDGMIMNNKGQLFTGRLEDNAVVKYDLWLSKWFGKYAILWNSNAFQDDINLQWPDTFATDEDGNLWVTSDRLHRLAADVVDVQEVNFRIVRLGKVGKSNQYYGNGSAPVSPVISSSK